MLKLPEDFKAKWLAELRDPNARQTHGVLADWKGMCCLGVACKVHDPFTFRANTALSKGFVTRHGAVCLPRSGDVPDEALAVLNQPRHDVEPHMRSDDRTVTVQSFLSGKNDMDWTFAQIADWIEKHL